MKTLTKTIIITSLFCLFGHANANELGDLTKQIQQQYGKSACNKVVNIHGANDGTANIAECDTKIYTGNPEYFRITNNPQHPFIRCSSIGGWEYRLAKKCRGHTY